MTERLGGRAVVKAQVKTGGRGKAGGVKLASDPADAVEKAGAILGMDIKGHTVQKVMLAQTADIAEEYYVSFLLDRTNRTFLAMASVEGGVEIEEVAATKPEALAKIPVDAIEGVTDVKAREIAEAAKFPAEITRPGRRTSSRSCGTSSSARTRCSSRSTRWSRPATARSSRWTARSRSTRTPSSGSRTTRPSRTRPRPTPLRPRRRRRASTTSSSTARWASSATARGWSCPPSTSSRTRARRTTTSSPPTSSTSAAAPPPR